jgi:ssDNA-binding Zn-finger/Zn-ribbon topoisomerase 1
MVERTRRADGARFLGCQRYPTCRGTRELVAIDTPMPSTTAPAVAGASARSTYERRLAKHQDTTRAIRPLILTAGTVIVLTGLVLLTQESTLPILGLSLILFGVVWTLAGLFIKPDHVRAWRIGAEGEERVGVVLDALIADGFRILHDRRRPGGRDNIDHVVIGPPGIIVVETKHYQGKVRIQGGELVINGRRKTAFIDQVQRQRASVAQALDLPGVLGLICMVGAEFPLFRTLTLSGIDILPPDRLAKAMRSMPTVLTAEEVDRLSTLADRRLTSATASPYTPDGHRPGRVDPPG